MFLPGNIDNEVYTDQAMYIYCLYACMHVCIEVEVYGPSKQPVLIYCMIVLMCVYMCICVEAYSYRQFVCIFVLGIAVWYVCLHMMCRCVVPCNCCEINCIDNDECLARTAVCIQNCHNTNGSYTCGCDTGYTLNSNGFSCDGILIGRRHIFRFPYRCYFACRLQ